MDRIFHGYKVRYEYMNQYMLPIRASRKIRTINIYINLDDFYHKLHKPYTDGEFQTTGQSVAKQMVSNLLNLVGHYKNWAIKEHLHPTIYLIFTTSSIFTNTTLISGYRSHFIQIMDPKNPSFFYINHAIEGAHSVLQIVTKYVPNVYAIDSRNLEPSILPLYLSRVKPADYNLIISRDDYDLQYVEFTNWGIMVPKGDLTAFIVRGNLWRYIQVKEKIEESFYFNPEVYLLARAILGDKYRSIPKLTRTGWKTVIGYLREVISDDINMIEVQSNKLADYIVKRKIQDTDYNNNLHCMSVEKQVDALFQVDCATILQQLQDRSDPNELEVANRTLFREFPLNLPMLLREAPTVNDQPHDDYFWRKNQ